MARIAPTTTRLFVAESLTADASIPIQGDHANYLLNVLRLKQGDHILVFNGRDGEWRAQLGDVRKRDALLCVEAQTRPQTIPTMIDYCFAPIKHARLDYLVQKAVEMGAARLQPVITRRTQTTRLNLERMRANAIEAAEQCGVLSVPDIISEISFERFISQWPEHRLLVFCDESAQCANPFDALRQARQSADNCALSGVSLLVGPEGGFDEKERDLVLGVARHVRLSLGPRILRADTAAVAGLAIVQTIFGDWC